ncbi:heme ABC exporter ATP-binding protein CcmA [Paracoccus shanxieyensis]|uniref:Heme ABC exporter ATP-binding protein CcmA n=1 Tax=Paracoccus shanxieyensis TaxID=2675752 RepID=A0A6L6IYX0_9RHOB|nr:heme ABC exporter ATP-binding protein CcmA [Paracoccus shanxieyensis]MTH64768.1 heme ABC exporter ATP-binding protein CcmA [Paracoccus shanxieyensis]MTH87999.1 heme ABC exporter ATP-binding protein CcmA [Paracoccus shanxieyensis]
MSLLAARDLAVARGGLRALEGVSFQLDPGRALILRGPNGIGKTTLLRTLAGLQKPVSGLIEGEDTAYAGHADGLKPALTARENLDFWRRVFGGPPIAGALAAMALQPLAARPAHALSAGQKRRLGLARLLVTGRRVWLLDEPTVSLDAASVGLFADMLRRHLGQGGAALIATHIDLGLDAEVLDLTPYRASAAPTPRPAGFNEAFG